MKQPNVTVYGTRACEDTARVCRVLDEQKIPYEFRDLDDSPELSSYIAGLNGGHRVTPTVRLDNHTLIKPSDQELIGAYGRAGAARS
ncbi:MAG TPA: glutaredoxin domain-containing protein [Isosphaeraceae bacterium]|jgi:glutaredoxin|nr:glutaredoxin domain-containing protein [Isosphaeraceae bacterium]